MTRPPGSQLRVEWVATPPVRQRARPASRPRLPYAGPPSYPAVPRWGFPLLSWRWPLALPGPAHPDYRERVASLAATGLSTLWITAAVALGAAGAELWRYVLLLLSRGDALPKTMLAISDALVATMGILTWILGAVSALIVVMWTLRARVVAGQRTGTRPARPDWQCIVGLLLPGLNLFVPGSVLAELEHSALTAENARDGAARPRPSRLVVGWWGAWAGSLLLGWLSFIWSFRDGVQAMADGVVLHAWNDVSVAVLALMTARLIKYLTVLLTPVDTTALPQMRVVGVHGAPPPPRLKRSAHTPR